MYVDWSERGEYMRLRHGVSVEVAQEALSDENAVWFDPDPKSSSGLSQRVIGFSTTANELITVILMRRGSTQSFWGVNGWPANAKDRRRHGRQFRK